MKLAIIVIAVAVVGIFGILASQQFGSIVDSNRRAESQRIEGIKKDLRQQNLLND